MIRETNSKILKLKNEMVSGRQCAAARAWLRMSQVDLVELSGVYRLQIIDFERGKEIKLKFQAKIDEALIAQGITFSEGGAISLPR